MNKAQYVRAHLEVPDWVLAEGLDETLYYVRTSKLVAVQESLQKKGTGHKNVYVQLTYEMKRFLLDLDAVEKLNHREIKTAFNHLYEDENFTPVSQSTVSRCVKSAKGESEFNEGF